jgi:adenosylcobinamide kinase / adenosylcobinamide-phosphate guanylyltransferase
MLWLITGGIACGKSAFAEELALTVGREAICLSCPPLPEVTTFARERDFPAQSQFFWTDTDADDRLAAKIRAINVQSNFFRAEQRLLLVDSISGWLRALVSRADSDDPHFEIPQIEAAWSEVLDAILSFQGKMIVVTEDAAAGLSLGSWERWYTYKLADANRTLADASDKFYRLSAGIAMEVKGYRVKRGNIHHENIYPDRR